MRGPVYETFSFGRNYIQFFISRLVLKRFLCRLYQRPSYGIRKKIFFFTLRLGLEIASQLHQVNPLSIIYTSAIKERYKYLWSRLLYALKLMRVQLSIYFASQFVTSKSVISMWLIGEYCCSLRTDYPIENKMRLQ